MVKMQAPEGMKSFSHAGVAYEVKSDGTAEVPAHAVEELKSHGLTVHVPKAEAKREKK